MWSLSLMVKAEESHRMVSTRAHPAKTLQVGLQDSIRAATERAMLVAGKCLDKAHSCSGDGKSPFTNLEAFDLKYLIT